MYRVGDTNFNVRGPNHIWVGQNTKFGEKPYQILIFRNFWGSHGHPGPYSIAGPDIDIILCIWETPIYTHSFMFLRKSWSLTENTVWLEISVWKLLLPFKVGHFFMICTKAEVAYNICSLKLVLCNYWHKWLRF